MNKKLGIIESDNKDIIFAIEKYFYNKDVEVKIINSEYDLSEFDLVVLTGFDATTSICHNNILNIYPSLLPAFENTDNPISAVFLAGVKVSGITIHKVNSDKFFGKILTQYPVLLGNDIHIEELIEELSKISQKIYPIVIESVLEDKVFDFSDLFNSSSCNGGCGGCKGCH